MPWANATPRAQAQDAPDPRAAKPERPTVATHAFAVAPGILELEIGWQWQRPDPASTLLSVPALFKIGLADHLQLDLAPSWERDGPKSAERSGLGDTILGLKWQAAGDAPVLGAVALQATIKLATGSLARGTGTGTTDLNLVLISSHEAGGLSIDINAGYTRRSGDGHAAPKDATWWTFSFGLPVDGRLSWAAEVFGYPGTSGRAGARPIVAILTGPAVTLNRSVVLDAGAIFNVTGFGGTAVYGGATWNIGRLWTPRRTPPRRPGL